MKLRTHPPEIPNPGGLSVHNPRPKFWSDRERYFQEKKQIEDGLADKEKWAMYHKKLPLGHVPLAQDLPDKFVKKEADPFLEKDKWESQYILLSRTVIENQIIGKPPVQKYFVTMKPENLQ